MCALWAWDQRQKYQVNQPERGTKAAGTAGRQSRGLGGRGMAAAPNLCQSLPGAALTEGVFVTQGLGAE